MKKSTRKSRLVLARETLRALTTPQLAEPVGGVVSSRDEAGGCPAVAAESATIAVACAG